MSLWQGGLYLILHNYTYIQFHILYFHTKKYLHMGWRLWPTGTHVKDRVALGPTRSCAYPSQERLGVTEGSLCLKKGYENIYNCHQQRYYNNPDTRNIPPHYIYTYIQTYMYIYIYVKPKSTALSNKHTSVGDPAECLECQSPSPPPEKGQHIKELELWIRDFPIGHHTKSNSRTLSVGNKFTSNDLSFLGESFA